jgi:hypothetical protein
MSKKKLEEQVLYSENETQEKIFLARKYYKIIKIFRYEKFTDGPSRGRSLWNKLGFKY